MESPDEAAAAGIVAELMGAPLVRVDGRRRGSGLSDFEVELGTGAVPLEVTRLTNRRLIEFWAAIAKHDGRHVDGITSSWWIGTTYDEIDVRKLLARSQTSSRA